jgi:exosortase/archaeosortase family protein
VTGKVYLSISVNGLSAAATSLFGISALVIICVYLVFTNLAQADKNRPFQRDDIPFLTLIIAANLIPTSVVSWLCLTALGAREYYLAGNDRISRRAAALMLGSTMAMFWGRLVFTLASNFILKGDAILVSIITGSARVGNVVYLPNDAGFLWIADPCSSFQNISLAILCWLMFTEYANRPRTTNDYWVCFLACVNVVIINVTRIAILARRPDLFEFVHGPYGAAIAGYLSTIIVLVICATGIKREQVATA